MHPGDALVGEADLRVRGRHEQPEDPLPDARVEPVEAVDDVDPLAAADLPRR